MNLLIAYILISLTSSANIGEKVYVLDGTIDKYLYKDDLPAMDDYTYCLWLTMEDGNTECYPASIASNARQSDFHPPPPLLRTAGKTGWHKHCFVNKKGHYSKWFMDRQTPGVVEEIQTADSVAGILADSALVLIHEQDSFKRGSVLAQTCQSKMSMFNMWDKAMTETELNALFCQDKGNVVNMDNIESIVAPEYDSYPFPCHQGEKVYIQNHSITDYLYKYDLPAMDDYTYCLWLNMEDEIDECYPVSISSRSYNNELLSGWAYLKGNDSQLYIAVKDDPIELTLSQELRTAVKEGWHKHCFVNKKDHYIKWFMDSQTPGVLQEIHTNASFNGIANGSALILLQEQDSFKGALELSQVCQSKMSMFNMWDKAMTQTELNALGCQDKGNVVNMDKIEIEPNGTAPKFVMEMSPCPSASAPVLPFCTRDGIVMTPIGDCTHFDMTIGNQTPSVPKNVTACPAGRLFDTNRCVCDWPRNVTCSTIYPFIEPGFVPVPHSVKLGPLMKVGHMIKVTGTPNANANAIGINFCKNEGCDSFISLHFAIRFQTNEYANQVILNDKVGNWNVGGEVKPSGFPLQRGQQFTLSIKMLADKYKMTAKSSGRTNEYEFIYRQLPLEDFALLSVQGDMPIVKIEVTDD